MQANNNSLVLPGLGMQPAAGRRRHDDKKAGKLFPAFKQDLFGLGGLLFFHGDGVAGADFHAGFAAQAFLGVHGVGLAVFEFINLGGAYIHTFAVAGAFVGVYNNIPTHGILPC